MIKHGNEFNLDEDKTDVQTTYDNVKLNELTLTNTVPAYYRYNLMNMQAYSSKYLGGNSEITVGKYPSASSVFLDSTPKGIEIDKTNYPFPNQYYYITRNSIRFTDYIANPVLTGLIDQFEKDSKDNNLLRVDKYYT